MPESKSNITSGSIDVAALKKRLPVGWIGKVNAKLNNQYSKTTISLVLMGERRNLDIIEAAIEVAEEKEAREAELAERIKNTSAQ